jgi:hypothetical protein
MSTKVLLKKSSVPAKVPTSADLSYGEVALNYADGKLYYKDSTNAIKHFSATPQLSINDLTDVDTSSTIPTVGQVLKWNGTNWVPGDDATVGGGGTDADTLDGFDSSYFLNYNNLSNKPTIFSGDYNDLTNTPSIPSLISDLTNDVGFITSAALTGYATETYVNTAVSNIIDGAPALLDTLNELAAALGDDSNFVTTINNQLSLKANTADLASVASSGSYDDLLNKPTIFSGDYNDLTNKPTTVSSFTNDANYVNAVQLETKQNTLVSSTNIKTINGQSLLGSGNITITGGTGDGLYTNSVTLSTTSSNQEVDSFDITQYRTVKYLIQIISGGEVESVEINLMHTDVGVLISQYNRMTSGTELGAFSAGIDTSNAYLRFSPVNPDTTIDLTRISIIARTLNPLLLLNDLETQTLTTIDLETDSYPTTDLN